MRFESFSAKGVLALVSMLGLLPIAALPASAQTFSVIHTFTGTSDGQDPIAGFIIDEAGNLYGTATGGGSSWKGLVYKFDASGVQTVLHNFTGGTDGQTPEGRLVMDKMGNLYGTTNAGGASNAGTVFQVSANGKEKVLHAFTGATDGGSPVAGLSIDKAGNLYGTTTAGGSSGNGTVFKLVKPTGAGGAWKEEVLYSFGTGTDGAVPIAGVILDASGNLYGTTSAGGTYGYGTVFELKRSAHGYTEAILYEFTLGLDGGTPYAGLVMDSKGNLYGAASDGGGGGDNGGGTVFELSRVSGGWTFNVISALAGWGISGTFRDLLLEGTTIYATTHCDGDYSAGTVYKLTQTAGSWTYTSLYVFTGGSDGLFSFSNLVSDKQGNLYGTTNEGGADGSGTAFKVTP
jgi:uncharacterized repeat protein (TIGR03803 family)